MTEPNENDKQFELIDKLLFSADTEEEWIETNEELKAQPREPGKYKIRFGDRPPRPCEPWEGVCPDCGKLIQSSGGGISFADIPCSLHTGDCLVMHVHWSEDCRGWKHRKWRFWHIHTWGKVDRRWKSYKWRKRAKQERKDPAKWVDYWKDGGI